MISMDLNYVAVLPGPHYVNIPTQIVYLLSIALNEAIVQPNILIFFFFFVCFVFI